MTSHLVIFRAFFFFFFRPLDPKSEKKSLNQLIKNSGLITDTQIRLFRHGVLSIPLLWANIIQQKNR